MLEKVHEITDKISMNLLGKEFTLRVEVDNENPNGRVFLQVVYMAPCTKTRTMAKWKGRKWYLSTHMTDDEIVKTAYAAFEAAVKHEVMEGFKYDNVIVFNPHVNFQELLKISSNEIFRN